MGFFESKFKLIVSSKDMSKGDFVAKLQTWPSQIPQLRKSLLNL